MQIFVRLNAVKTKIYAKNTIRRSNMHFKVYRDWSVPRELAVPTVMVLEHYYLLCNLYCT